MIDLHSWIHGIVCIDMYFDMYLWSVYRGNATDNQIHSVFYIGGVHYTFTALELSICQSRWFSESGPLGLLSAGVTTSFVDGFSMTMLAPCQTLSFQERLAQTTNIACSTTAQWLGWCVTWEQIQYRNPHTHNLYYIWYEYVLYFSIRFIYLCTFPTWSTQDLDNFPTQISGEVEWPLIFTGSDVCSWKEQKAT